MRVLVTGTKGQLVRALLERGPAHGAEIVAFGRPRVDLSREDDPAEAIAEVHPDAVVNAAAYTAVDRAESERDLAEAINGHGAGLVSRAAATLGLPVIQMSTDYVFDGTARHPYREDDAPAPLGAYGASKLSGETAVAAANPDHVILRTSWVYAPFGQNFVRTMLRLAGTQQEIGVVSDQRGVPNAALDLADAVLAVARNIVSARKERSLYGTFHLTAPGETTWANFASEIFRLSGGCGGPKARVRPVVTAAYPTAARRPAYSCLDGSRLAAIHGVRIPDWRPSLAACIARLLAAERETVQ